MDPFLFCVHHDDQYPEGNASFGPAASLEGRHLGSDFGRKDGWSMYHGRAVPGFPKHPHRGFETVTVVREGLIDHADSLGAAARYGHGDVQWLTAGDGINHAEMFPLLNRGEGNPIDFFQIWLNLPASHKRVNPEFTMLWRDSIPVISQKDNNGRAIEVTVIAGKYREQSAAQTPVNSWAANPENDVAIWTIKMAAKAHWTLPKTLAATHRALYVLRGNGLHIHGQALSNLQRVELKPDQNVLVENGDKSGELLLLQGRPIGETVAHHGPFVMNTRQEIVEAYGDYNRTGFGGWPWSSVAPIHGAEPERFARHADGRKERPLS
jgi:redox-sensitive bicupin YhaK (pirin superfamily)